MSSYLTDLARRTVAPETSVRPRVRGLYEPLPTPGAPAAWLVEEAGEASAAIHDVPAAAASVAEDAVRGATAAPRHGGPTATVATPPGPARTGPRARGAGDVDAPPERRADAGPDPRRRQPWAHPFEAREGVPPSDPGPLAQDPPSGTPRVDAIPTSRGGETARRSLPALPREGPTRGPEEVDGTESPVAVRVVQVPSLAVDPALRAAVGPDPQPDPLSSPVAPVPGVRSRPRTGPTDVLGVPFRASPSPLGRAVPAHMAPPDADPPPAPDVHVTIGRVEVRATPAASTEPRREPARRPAMGLAEYLEKRASRP